MKRGVYTTLVILLITISASYGATRTAVANGSWLSAAVWDCTCVPSINDNIVIPAPYKVNIVSTIISFVDLTAISIDVYGEIDLINASLNLNSYDILRLYPGGRISESGLGGILTSGVSTFTSFPVNGPATITNGALPVVLSYFGVDAVDDTVIIRWESSSEVNVAHYVIERSVDGNHFSPLAEVMPRGERGSTTNYEHLDSDPFVGSNYYRLKSIDLDGYEEIFEVKLANVSTAVPKVTLFPVPVVAKNLNLKLNFKSGEHTLLRVISSLGRPLIEKSFLGMETELDMSALAPGIYYVESTTTKGKFLQRIFVQ